MRDSILQPPNVLLLSEDVVQSIFPIHDKRNRPETSGGTYGECISCDSMDSLMAGPSHHLLSRADTRGVECIGPANSVATSEKVAPPSQIKDKRKRIEITGSPVAKTNRGAKPSIKGITRMESCAIIARFVELGGCITRKQLQAAQRQYIKKPEDLILLLDKDIRDLCAEIEILEQQRQRVLSSVAFAAYAVWSTAVEYFRLVRFGLPHTGALLGFVREAMNPDMVFNAEYGPGAILQYWCFATWFSDVEVEVEGWERNAGGSLVALTTTSVTLTKQTLRNVYPHLHTMDNSDHNCKQVKQLLNQRLVMHGSTCFDWDISTCRVTRVLAQRDMLTPMLRLLGNLEDASLVFEKALISPEFQWKQIMY